MSMREYGPVCEYVENESDTGMFLFPLPLTQVTSIVVLYGPRTTALVVCDDGVYEFTCGAGNKWFASRERIQIKQVCLYMEPASRERFTAQYIHTLRSVMHQSTL